MLCGSSAALAQAVLIAKKEWVTVLGATSVTFVLPWLSFIYIPCIFDEFCDARVARNR